MNNWMQMFGHLLKPPKNQLTEYEENSMNQQEFFAKMEQTIDKRNETLGKELEAARQQNKELLGRVEAMEKRLLTMEESLKRTVPNNGDAEGVVAGPAGAGYGFFG